MQIPDHMAFVETYEMGLFILGNQTKFIVYEIEKKNLFSQEDDDEQKQAQGFFSPR